MKRILLLLTAVFIAFPGFADVLSEEVSYSLEGKSFKGYLAFDDSVEGKRPGVIVVHEWWGHNDYARKRAQMLAELGYVALALDMYGDGKVAAHPDDARKFSGEVFASLDEAQARFNAGLEVLKDHAMTDPDAIAAIGYCFGGGVVLHMARFGMDLDAVVSFHGSLSTQNPAKAGSIKADILVLTGADDEMVSKEQVEAFKREMDAADANYKVISYEGARHSFTNPGADAVAEKFGLPIGYDAAADRESWQQMQAFLSASFDK